MLAIKYTIYEVNLVYQVVVNRLIDLSLSQVSTREQANDSFELRLQLRQIPEVVVAGHEGAACAGWHEIARRLQAAADGQGGARVVLVIDCYHGVDQDELRSQLLARLGPHTLIEVEQARLPESKVLAMLERFITEDRVFGVLAPHKMVEFLTRPR